MATADSSESRFWEQKSLDEMDDAEWESLCDGCGQCCLLKLEDEDSGIVHVTSVACRLLTIETARCSRYEERFEHVRDCLSVRPLNEQKLRWLPESCAYRRLAEGQGLAEWHPLLSGDRDSVVEAGIGMAGRCVSEDEVSAERVSEYVIHWIDPTD